MKRTSQLLRGALAFALLLTTLPATAQTFFGSGGTNNSSAYIGNYNVGLGYGVLASNTTGTTNTATGFYSLFTNTTGSANTATGSSALQYNTTGSANTANGFSALYFNTTGNQNTANGYYASTPTRRALRIPRMATTPSY